MENKIDFNLVRQCMVEYAEQLGRPYFEMCVVKRVVNSFITGVDDVFKPAIQEMVDDNNKRNAVNRRRELINEFCEDKSYMKLAALSDISAPTLRRIMHGTLNCTDDQWARLLNGFEVMTGGRD